VVSSVHIPIPQNSKLAPFPTVQLTSTRLVVWNLLMTCMALHACFAIVVPSAMMHVQNYAGSGIKHGSC